MVTLRRTLVASLSLCLWVGGCGGGSSGPDQVIDLTPFVNEFGSLPELEPAFTIEETRALREGFSWDTFTRVPERDADGRPTLYYVLLYVDELWQTGFIRGLGLHSSFVPLFQEERDRWNGQAGFFTLEGDREGVFMFAMVPGFFLNALKDAADAGEPAFTAAVIREPPAAGSAMPDGSISYDYLAEQDFLYGGAPAPTGQTEAPANSGTVDSATAALFPTPSRSLRAAVGPIEDLVDEFRAFFGELDRAAAGSADITVAVRPLNTDGAFGEGTPIVRAWGVPTDEDRPWIPTLGETLWFRNITVQSHKGASLFRGNTGRDGLASFTVAKGEQNLCAELANPAAEVTNFLTALVLCNFNDPARPDLNLDIQADDSILMDVQDYRTNFFAQAQDSYDYMTWVVGRSPRQARIITGFFADIIGEINGGLAFVACLGNGLDLPSVVLGSTPILNNLLPLDVDIIMPFDQGQSARSRGVLTHEYGHFALCDVMHQTNAVKYAEQWSNVTVNIFGGPGPDNEIVYINEAFADFFALQVLGGTNYPTLNNAELQTGLGYCPVTPEARAQDCAEDNVGGPTQGLTVTGTQNYNIARAVTLLHDAFDGAADTTGLYQTNTGAAFEFDGATSMFLPPVRGQTNVQDEAVALPGRAYLDFVRNLFDHASTLDERNFHNALARTALQYGHTEQEVCDMFNLHAGVSGVPGLEGVPDYQDCRDMIDPEALSFGAIPPSSPTDILVRRDPAMPTEVVFEWRDLSLIADRYDVSLTGGPGAGNDTVDYRRAASYSASGLAADNRYTFTTTTVNGTNTSSSSATFVTFAFAPTSLSASAGPGSASLSWTVPEPASGYEVWELAPDERLLFTTADTTAVVRGLSDTTDYQFAVASLNQVGEASARTSSNVVRPETPTIYFVAPDGSDVAPGAGSQETPFATVATAVSAATSAGINAVWLLEGDYTETQPIAVTNDLDLVGGFDRSSGSWVPGSTRSRIVTIALGTARSGPRTRIFNEGSRLVEASVFVDDVSLVTTDIDWRYEGPATVSRCVAIFHTVGSLTVNRSSAQLVPSGTPIQPCVGAILANDAAVRVNQSDLVGWGDRATLPIVTNATALAVEDGQIDVIDSTLVGYAGTGINSGGTNVRLSGVTGNSVTSLRASRVTASAMTPETSANFPSGRMVGLEATVRGAVVIDDSVFRTPSGASKAVALELASVVGMKAPAVTLAHVTASAGADWDMGGSFLGGSPRAALKLDGSFGQFLLVNSILSYAGGALDTMGTAWAALDLSGIADPFDFVLARGNVFSLALLDANLPAFGSASDALIFCADNEFGLALNEVQSNDPAFYACATGASTASWSIGDNEALLQLPSPAAADNPSSPHAIAFDDVGFPVVAYPALTSSLSKVRAAGVNLSSLPSSISAPSDRGGAPRSDSNVRGPGAWIVP